MMDISVVNQGNGHISPALIARGTKMSDFARDVYRQKYSLDGTEEWEDTARRVAVNVMAALGYSPDSLDTRQVEQYIRERKFIPGGRYLYASGRSLHQVQNCLLMKAEDSREGWGDLWRKSGMALMTGAGIGVDYSDIRAAGSPVGRTGGEASGPISLAHSVNEIGRQVMQGGSRRSAIWMGLNWRHPDIMAFIQMKDWSKAMRAARDKDQTFPLPMELTNISVQLDDDFFYAYHNPAHADHHHAHMVYWRAVKRMLKTGEPGFSIDTGDNAGETLRNACTEVTSADDSDICNLGSINLGRIESREEFRAVLASAVLFLLAGTVYSHVPYDKVRDVRKKNRRLGLGLMGIHEWLLQRGRHYGADIELEGWLEDYATSTEIAAAFADLHSLSRPTKTRAIAPTGTIAIIGETTTGIEPVFCTAYERRWLNGKGWQTQYVVDPTVERLVQKGVDPEAIEDAYMLANHVERRVEFQVWVQQYVDHGISSTINLPAPITDEGRVRRFGEMLLPHLPRLRGLTCYPNGARGGQPIVAVPYDYAVSQDAAVEETEERCVGGACSV
jgi:ribonucleoside-diphosphate reductase alpha chain